MLKKSSIIFISILILLCMGCATTSNRFRPPAGGRSEVLTLETRGFCPCGKCCNWKRSWLRFGRPVVAHGPNRGKPKKVGMTASGVKAKKGTISADTSRFPFGTVMYIPGYGYGRVEDRGSSTQGDRIDLFFKKHKDAIRWGKQTKEVKVWYPPGI
ncbi:MAG TPA: 3D domain-containing protein [Candidatus Hydrogenedens sp.]|nr:3D domain-containing protein [Candidatus Hydrogenedens sp.]HOL20966.1 3D domain-containing protein [Candidatus Hydrogenedens sp.]HPP59680.1 3D domain-containing protein [Candidatus Hydrogenedens sp.]